MSKYAIPYFFSDETALNGTLKNNPCDSPNRDEGEKDSLYNELTLIPSVRSIKTSVKPGENIKVQEKNKVGNLLDRNQNSVKEITLNEDSVCRVPLNTRNQEISEETQCEISKLEDVSPRLSPIYTSDCESDSPYINQDLSISVLRESIQNDLKEYVRCRKDLELTLEQNIGLQKNVKMPQFTFDSLFRGTISIKIPPSWYKILPDTVDNMVVFANFVLRTDNHDKMLVSYKSICIGKDRIAKCSILDKSLNIFPNECITSSQQLETIITNFDTLLICKGVILGKEFAYYYSPLCYLDKQGHWRHRNCSLITVRGFETCLCCNKVQSILTKLKNRKKPGRKSKIKT